LISLSLYQENVKTKLKKPILPFCIEKNQKIILSKDITLLATALMINPLIMFNALTTM